MGQSRLSACDRPSATSSAWAVDHAPGLADKILVQDGLGQFGAELFAPQCQDIIESHIGPEKGAPLAGGGKAKLLGLSAKADVDGEVNRTQRLMADVEKAHIDAFFQT